MSHYPIKPAHTSQNRFHFKHNLFSFFNYFCRIQSAYYNYTQFKKFEQFLKKFLVAQKTVSTIMALNILPDYMNTNSPKQIRAKFSYLSNLQLWIGYEIACHYLLHCPNFTNERSIPLDPASRINNFQLLVMLLLPNFFFMVTNH